MVRYLRDEFTQNTGHTLLPAHAERLPALIVLNTQLENLFRRIEFHSGTAISLMDPSLEM
jgi:hypothetical protein